MALCYTALVILAVKQGMSAMRRRRLAPRSEGHRNETPPSLASNDRCLVFLSLFYVISYSSWIWMSSIYRYLAVLELLAPAFVILAARRFVKRESILMAFAAAIIVFTALFSVPIHFGRAGFADDLVKMRVPPIRDLDRSVVLMSGYEPTSYIIPSFPVETRFVRVSSTLAAPGRIPAIDDRIKGILAKYDATHRFAFIRSIQEIGLARQDISPFGLIPDAASCYEIHSRDRKANQGFICGMIGESVQALEKPVPELSYRPSFVPAAGVRLEGRLIGKHFDGRVEGIRAASVDILFKINAELMPVVRRWPLSGSGDMHLGPLSRSGNYQIIGIRDSDSSDPDNWIPVSTFFHFE
jgi:hypothetical protein